MFRPIFYVLASTLGALLFSISPLVHEPSSTVLPPNLVCKNLTLSVTGTDTIYIKKDSLYSSVSAGATVKIRRLTATCNPLDTILSDSIRICCSDVGQTIMVQVTAMDGTGSTTCMAAITVSDKLPPQISSPLMDITVSCTFPLNVNSLDTFGTYTDDITKVKTRSVGGVMLSDGIVTDFCKPITISKSSSTAFGSCGLGVITRIFSIKDNSNNEVLDTQYITIVNATPATANNITWPRDTTILGCFKPPYAQNLAGEPSFTTPANGCAMFQYSKVDMLFDDPLSGCPYLMRTWRVIDMCTVNPSRTQGYFEHVQNIYFRDTVKPTITGSCTDTVVLNPLGPCTVPVAFSISGSDNCTLTKNLAFGYSVSRIDISGNTIGSPILVGATSSFSGTLAQGVYKVTWSVDDRCGNIATCSFKLTTKESKPPSPVLMAGVVVGLPKACDVAMKASSFNIGSYDNCSASNALRYAFSANINDTIKNMTCANLGINKVNIFVFDEAGNFSTVPVTVDVQDNDKHCPTSLVFEIKGQIATDENQAINEAKLTLEGAEQQREVMTDIKGNYSMSNLEANSIYELMPTKEGKFLEEVNVLDLLEMQKHILGIKKLTTNSRKIAADIDGNQRIDVADLVELRKILLGIKTNEVNSPAWRVVTQRSLDLEQTWPMEEKVIIKELNSDQIIDFKAIKLGDINGSVNAKLGQRSKSSITLYTPDQLFEKGSIVRVPIQIDHNLDLNALQLEINYNGENLTLRGIEAGTLPVLMDATNTSVPGKIVLSHIDVNGLAITGEDKLFTLIFTANSASDLSQSITMISPELKAIMSDVTNNTYDVNLKVLSEGKVVMTVGQNVPNPFDHYTDLTFELAQDMPVEVSVLDQNGRNMFRSYQTYQKGKNTITFTDEHFKGNVGLFFVHIESAEVSLVRKILRIK